MKELKPNERVRKVLESFNNREREDPKPRLSPDEIRYKSLLIIMERQSISFRQAVKIVGGVVRLNRLIDDGEIRCDKPSGASNMKWKINASDCYRHIKPKLNAISNAM